MRGPEVSNRQSDVAIELRNQGSDVSKPKSSARTVGMFALNFSESAKISQYSQRSSSLVQSLSSLSLPSQSFGLKAFSIP